MNRMVWCRRATRTTGRPGAHASVIQHVGVVDNEDGFVIGLLNGTSPDWLKNVLATGTVTIYGVDQFLFLRPSGTDIAIGYGS